MVQLLTSLGRGATWVLSLFLQAPDSHPGAGGDASANVPWYTAAGIATVVAAIGATAGSFVTSLLKAKGKSADAAYRRRAKEDKETRDGQDLYYEKIRKMFEETREEIKVLQTEHMACREENAGLRATVAQQGREIENLTKRLQALETRQ